MPRGRPSKYTKRHRYVIEVLFLHGLSPAAIARVMSCYGAPMTPAAVSGQIASLNYRKADMPQAVRQRFLDEKAKNRLDKDGRSTPLPDWAFTARAS